MSSFSLTMLTSLSPSYTAASIPPSPVEMKEDPLKEYIIEGNVETVRDAMAIVYLDDHSSQEQQAFNAGILEGYYQEGDGIWVEDWENSSFSKMLRYPPLSLTSSLQNKEISIKGWLSPELQEKLKNLVKEAYREATMDTESTDLAERVELPKSKADQIGAEFFPSSQACLIEKTNNWIEHKSSNSSRLHIFAGRHHGNPYLEKNPFKPQVQQFIQNLSKTNFLIIDFYKKEYR